MSGHENVTMRRFVLERFEDVSGTSGTGVVAEGVEFSNGQVVLHWTTQLESVSVYANHKVLEQVHGHGGRTIIRWIDNYVANEQSSGSIEKCEKSASEFSYLTNNNPRVPNAGY